MMRSRVGLAKPQPWRSCTSSVSSVGCPNDMPGGSHAGHVTPTKAVGLPSCCSTETAFCRRAVCEHRMYEPLS